MCREFEITEDNMGIYLHERTSGYTLIVDWELSQIDSLIVKSAVTFTVPYKGNEFLITSRELKNYKPEVRDLKTSPEFQYTEVGAGLGEFIPYIASKGVPLPMVIDPADYPLMKDMLMHMKSCLRSNDHEDYISCLIDRCEIIMDPGKVKLFNTYLGEALKKYPQLERSSDVVVDNWGPRRILVEANPKGESKDEIRSYIEELEKRLLRLNGELY